MSILNIMGKEIGQVLSCLSHTLKEDNYDSKVVEMSAHVLHYYTSISKLYKIQLMEFNNVDKNKMKSNLSNLTDIDRIKKVVEKGYTIEDILFSIDDEVGFNFTVYSLLKDAMDKRSVYIMFLIADFIISQIEVSDRR